MTSSPPSDPDTGYARGAAITGVTGHMVQADARIGNGPAGLYLPDLPEAGARETRDRIRAAVLNSGLPWPGRTINVRLTPASLARRGTGLDLPIAIAVLTAAGAIPAHAADQCLFTAELGLDGSLRPVRGILPAVLAATAAGHTRAFVAVRNSAEAATAPGADVIGCRSLTDVLAWLRHEPFPAGADTSTDDPAPLAWDPPVISMAGVNPTPHVRLALETAAAGGHHICLTGPAGPAIPALAAGLAAMLPPLNPREITEVGAVHSIAGLLRPGRALITRAPFRAPHHTATLATILGGGQGGARPGEAALAHRGVLFLADAPEFARCVLHSLRQPLQDQEVTVARSGTTARFPAKFTLVASMAPCPCGAQPGCTCSPLQARRYRARVTDELAGHVAIWLPVTQPGRAHPSTADTVPPPDAISAGRVADARARARQRLEGTPWQLNADVPGAELRRRYQPPAEAFAPVSRAVDLGEISVRAASQIIRVAWTLADLVGQPRPGAGECGQALAFYLGVTR